MKLRSHWLTAARTAVALIGQALKISIERMVSRVATGHTTDQINKAVELIEDGGIHPLRKRIWLTVSTDGTRIHRTTADHCTCDAGIKGRGCYHQLAVTAHLIPA